MSRQKLVGQLQKPGAVPENVEFLVYNPDAFFRKTSAESSAGVTPTNYQYEPGDVRRYGAVGDGTTNDTPALHRAFAVLEASSGMVIQFEHGKTYLQGAGSDSVTYESNTYFPARFNISDVSGFKIKGNGATITADTSLTDTQFNRGFQFDNCTDFEVSDLTYDGRLDSRTVFGGDAFNSGNELTGNRKSSFNLENCSNYRFINVTSDRAMMDGFALFKNSGGAASTGCFDGVFLNCHGLRGYRQGASIVSGSRNTFIGGQYSNTGTVKGTAPKAGIDIESDSASVPNIGNTFIGVKFENNVSGLFFALGAEGNTAIGCEYKNNDAYGVAFTNDASCKNNSVFGGQLYQTESSSESEKQAVYIGGDSNTVRDLKCEIAEPHKGLVFLNFSTTKDCAFIGGEIVDTTASPSGSFNQLLAHIPANTVNCRVVGTSLRDATGTGLWHALIESTTAVFDDNEVRSSLGSSGARGVQVVDAASVKNNRGGGTKLTATADSAVFNIASTATTIQQMGPNIDEDNPRVGGVLRRLNFDAETLIHSSTYDPASIAAGATLQADFTVTGAVLGDHVQASFGSPGSVIVTGAVSAADTVKVSFYNPTGSAIDLGSANVRIKVTSPVG